MSQRVLGEIITTTIYLISTMCWENWKQVNVHVIEDAAEIDDYPYFYKPQILSNFM